MKITKAKLVKGNFLEVTFDDNSAIVTKSYPHTEAPPRLQKSFMSLNHDLCTLTEQYDGTGKLDYDNTVCRGYSFKGDGESEGFTLTGIRMLSNGKVLTLPKTPFLSSSDDDGYGKHAMLIKKLEKCREEISLFMENNKSSDEIQPKLFDKNNTFIVKSEKTAEDEANDLPDQTKAVIEEIISEQEKLDLEMPLTDEMVQANNAKKNRSRKER